jgi:YD repeat-containing protein
MSKTRADIQAKTIAILVGGDVGFNPSDEDATTVDGYIDAEVAEINADGTTYINDPDESGRRTVHHVLQAGSERCGGRVRRQVG